MTADPADPIAHPVPELAVARAAERLDLSLDAVRRALPGAAGVAGPVEVVHPAGLDRPGGARPDRGDRAGGGDGGDGRADRRGSRHAGRDSADRLVALQVGDVTCEVSWHGPVAAGVTLPAGESCIQALSGLMHGHRSGDGRPRRVGLDLASAVAGMLATQGVLAGLIARHRGIPVDRVGTSVLQAGLLMVGHHVCNATCRDESWSPPEEAAGAGPPFRTADGHWIELETLALESWTDFWSELGAPLPEVGRGWNAFRRRYASGVCRLPRSLHAALVAWPLDRLAGLAERTGVSLCRVRSHGEVVTEAGADLHGLPVVDPLGLVGGAMAAAAGTTGPVGGGAAGAAGAAGAGRPGGDTVLDLRVGPVGPVGSTGAAPGSGASGPVLPLAGIRLVESTNRFAGPMAGQLLRMLGADVTRVEPPGGDPYRHMAPSTTEGGATFLHFNRGKAPVEIDLSNPVGRMELLDLMAGADAFLHNWRPGRAAKWQLGGADLADAHPSLVYACVSAWGPGSGMDRVLGTDFLVQAHTGLGDGINPADERGFPSRLTLSDYLAALVTCEGVLRALYERELTGRGREVHGSLAKGVAAVQGPALRERGPGRAVWSPLDKPLATVDGWLAVTVTTDHDLDTVARVLGMPPAEMVDADAGLLARRLADVKAADVADALAEAGVPSAPVCTDLAALPADPRFADLFDVLPEGVRAPTAPWSFSVEGSGSPGPAGPHRASGSSTASGAGAGSSGAPTGPSASTDLPGALGGSSTPGPPAT